jgi:hypothetical protein
MIFRLVHGSVRENLALVPVIREWRSRNPREFLFVETSMPEIFSNNPDVNGVGSWASDECAIDFDLLDDPGLGIHPIDLYALASLGDTRLLSRRMRVFVSPRLSRFGGVDRSVVYVGLDFAAHHRGLHEALMRRFPAVSTVGYCPNQIGDICHLLSTGTLFVGSDEDITWLAMTTEVPIIMLCGPRHPSACQPFREGIPFETVAWKCDQRDTCLKENASSGFGNIYHVYCRKEPPAIACKNRVSESELMAAVDRTFKS